MQDATGSSPVWCSITKLVYLGANFTSTYFLFYEKFIMSKLVNKVKIFSPDDARDYKYTAALVELPEEFISESILPIYNKRSVC